MGHAIHHKDVYRWAGLTITFQKPQGAGTWGPKTGPGRCCYSDCDPRPHLGQCELGGGHRHRGAGHCCRGWGQLWEGGGPAWPRPVEVCWFWRWAKVKRVYGVFSTIVFFQADGEQTKSVGSGWLGGSWTWRHVSFSKKSQQNKDNNLIFVKEYVNFIGDTDSLN